MCDLERFLQIQSHMFMTQTVLPVGNIGEKYLANGSQFTKLLYRQSYLLYTYMVYTCIVLQIHTINRKQEVPHDGTIECVTCCGLILRVCK